MSYIFTKQPGEKYTVGVDFSAVGALPEGATLSTCEATAFDAGTGAGALAVLGTSGSVSGARANVQVQAGVDGKDYNIKLLITLSSAEILEEDLVMQVREDRR